MGFPFRQHLTPNRGIASVIWSVGLTATRTLLMQLGLGPVASWLWSIITQSALTYLEHFIWYPRKIYLHDHKGRQITDSQGRPVYKLDRGRYGWLALVIDVSINFAGAWFMFDRLGGTSLMLSVYEMLNLTDNAAVIVPNAVRGILSIVGAFIVAVSPEEIWRLNDNAGLVAYATADDSDLDDNDSTPHGASANWQ